MLGTILTRNTNGTRNELLSLCWRNTVVCNKRDERAVQVSLQYHQCVVLLPISEVSKRPHITLDGVRLSLVHIVLDKAIPRRAGMPTAHKETNDKSGNRHN